MSRDLQCEIVNNLRILLPEQHCQHRNAVKQHKMRGIEDVEKVFELVFSGLTVVKRKWGKRKQRPDARRWI